MMSSSYCDNSDLIHDSVDASRRLAKTVYEEPRSPSDTSAEVHDLLTTPPRCNDPDQDKYSQ